MISKATYIIDVEIDHSDLDERKKIISNTRTKLKRAVFDSPDAIKPTKIRINCTPAK